MKKQPVIIAEANVKDAALFCDYVVPHGLFWRHGEAIDESVSLDELFRSLLPADLLPSLLNPLTHALSACLDYWGNAPFHADIAIAGLPEHDFYADPAYKRITKFTDSRDKAYSLIDAAENSDPDRYLALTAPELARDHVSQRPSDFLVTSLSGISIIDTTALKWDQILSVRSDPSAALKLRRLRSFFEEKYRGRSLRQIEDDLLTRIEDYNLVVKEHRLQTVSVVLDQFMSSKAVLIAGAGALAAALVGAQPTAAVLSASGVSVELGRIVLNLNVRRQQMRRELRELRIGYLIDVQQMVETKDNA